MLDWFHQGAEEIRTELFEERPTDVRVEVDALDETVDLDERLSRFCIVFN